MIDSGFSTALVVATLVLIRRRSRMLSDDPCSAVAVHPRHWLRRRAAVARAVGVSASGLYRLFNFAAGLTLIILVILAGPPSCSQRCHGSRPH